MIEDTALCGEALFGDKESTFSSGIIPYWGEDVPGESAVETDDISVEGNSANRVVAHPAIRTVKIIKSRNLFAKQFIKKIVDRLFCNDVHRLTASSEKTVRCGNSAFGG